MQNRRFAKIAALLLEVAILAYAITRVLKSRASTERRVPKGVAMPDLVEETSLESFPASDPPSWTGSALL